MYRGSCVKSYPKNELEVIDKSYANHKRRVENFSSNSNAGKHHPIVIWKKLYRLISFNFRKIEK